jgi:hypothetical protein
LIARKLLPYGGLSFLLRIEKGIWIANHDQLIIDAQKGLSSSTLAVIDNGKLIV